MYDTQFRGCKMKLARRFARRLQRTPSRSAKRRRRRRRSATNALINESDKQLTHSRHDRQNQQHAAHDYHLPSWAVGRWRRNHGVVIGGTGGRNGGDVAAVILFLAARGLSHTPTAPKGGETGARIRRIRPRRLSGIHRTRFIRRTDLAGRSSPPRISGFFLPLSFFFLPSDERAYESRSSNAAPLFRAASAPWTSQNVCYGHEERKVTAGIYARRARYRLSSWHSHLSSRAGNKEGSLGAIPTTARVAHHLGTIDVLDHRG